MKYAAIRAHQAAFAVTLMCRVLAVSRAGFYATGKRAVSARAKRDEELRTQIRVVHQQSRRTYGSPLGPRRTARHGRAVWTEKSRAPDAAGRIAGESGPPFPAYDD